MKKLNFNNSFILIYFSGLNSKNFTFDIANKIKLRKLEKYLIIIYLNSFIQIFE